jgi:hypothetical protein
MNATANVVKLTMHAAEVQFTVPVEAGKSYWLKGFVAGPVCEGRETVEVPYPFRAHPTDSPTELAVRVTIPDPFVWTESDPFEYRTILEIWEGEKMIERDGFRFQL